MKTKKQILKLFLLGSIALLLLNFPILSIFNIPVSKNGISNLYVYIFGVWFVLLIFVFIIIGRESSETKKGKDNE
jgi:pilus assembly protein TadC